MKTWKRIGAFILVFALILGLALPQSASAAKKKKVALNKKKLTLTVGKKYQLKLKNNKKKIKWSSNKKKIATVTKKGVVQAKKKGTAKITAKVGKKKYTCKVTVNEKKNTSNKKTDTKTGVPGKNIAINGDVFQVGTTATHQWNLGLGLTTAQVNTILGTLTVDVKRTEKSPQGFDVIAFRPNGNDSKATDKWGTYILLYLKDGKVVGICAIAKSVSYASGLISTGTAGDVLDKSDKWSRVGWYDTKGAKEGTGAYSTSTDNANVLAFVDYYGDNTTYCIQVFSNAYSIDSMTKLSSTDLSYSYADDVLTAMKTEAGEMLNAYLSYYGVRTMGINTKVSNAAQTYCNELKSSGVTNSSSVPYTQEQIYKSLAGAGVNCGKWGGRVLIGSMDAIGFVNSTVQIEEARNQLHDTGFGVMGLGSMNVNDGQFNYPCLIINYIDFIHTS